MLNTERKLVESKIRLTSPNTGKMIIYTSGWPKNQNRCWNKIRSPPPTTSKKQVLKLRSKMTIVTAPDKIGNVAISKPLVNKTPQIKRLTLLSICDLLLPAMTVPIVFKEFNILEIPNKWTTNMPQSTAKLLWKSEHNRVGYRVHPVPKPSS